MATWTTRQKISNSCWFTGHLHDHLQVGVRAAPERLAKPVSLDAMVRGRMDGRWRLRPFIMGSSGSLVGRDGGLGRSNWPGRRRRKQTPSRSGPGPATKELSAKLLSRQCLLLLPGSGRGGSAPRLGNRQAHGLSPNLTAPLPPFRQATHHGSRRALSCYLHRLADIDSED